MITHEVQIAENTFTFKVKENKIICEQFTDFTGTCLEEDFPNGDFSIWEMLKDKRLNDKDNINKLIYKLLKNPEEHKAN